MRVSIVLGLCVGAVLLSGCKTKYYYVDAAVPTGHDCPNGDECYGGTFCFEGSCTASCQSTSECWSGTECRPRPDTGELACLTVRYKQGPVMVGTPCGVDPAVCNGVDPLCDPKGNCKQPCSSDDECTAGFRCAPDFGVCMRTLSCHGRVKDDPDSFCSQECADDRDCPPTLYCETSSTADRPDRKVCARRQFCAPCLKDADCDILGGVCANDSKGGKFCTIPCTPAADASDPNFYTCPQPYAECKDNGDGRTLCHHRYGACAGDGAACAPCRSRRDCDVEQGQICFLNSYTKEQFCTGFCEASCSDAAYMCIHWVQDCQADAQCVLENAKCDPETAKCVPPNPTEGQCMLEFDWGCELDSSKPYGTPKYPTCYQSFAGPPCTSG